MRNTLSINNLLAIITPAVATSRDPTTLQHPDVLTARLGISSIASFPIAIAGGDMLWFPHESEAHHGE